MEGTYTSLPFGDALTTVSGTDLDPYHYAGLDHDYSSDTDHAELRQYANVAGRWMSPDPYSGSYDFTYPQSLNRYAYVLNSPLSAIDPLGLLCYNMGGWWSVTTAYGSTGGSDQINLCTDAEDYSVSEYINANPLLTGPLAGKFINSFPVIAGTKPGGGPQAPTKKQQQCAEAKARVANLEQQLSTPEVRQETNTYYKELGAGALIGCGAGALEAEAVTTAGGALVAGPPGAAGGAAAGTPLAVGNCAVGAVEGVVTANLVYGLSHLSLLGGQFADLAELAAAEAQEAIACN